MYVTQILWGWLLLGAFTPTALAQRHMQRKGHRKFELSDEADENEDVRNGPAPPGSVNYMQRYAHPFEGENTYIPRPFQSVQARMPFNEGFYRQRRDRPPRARRAHTLKNAGYYNPTNGRHFNEDPRGYFTRNDPINNHNLLQPYGNLYPPRTGGQYQQNAARYSRTFQPYRPNPNMLGAIPYYNRYYRQPFVGLHQNMPPPEEQHMRNQEEPSEDASEELTDSKEDQDEDMRKHGGSNVQGYPNGNMLENHSFYKRKYGKSSEVMHSHMPLTDEESVNNNEESSGEDAVEDQASEEGKNENVRKGARRYKEDIPNYNMLEEMPLHSLNSMKLRSDEVSGENQDFEKYENTVVEIFPYPTMSEEMHRYDADYGEASQADQQNTKTTGDETASLESSKISEADQQNTTTTEDETSLKSATASQADQQNTETMGDEAASLESMKTTQADQQNTKITHNETASLESATTSQIDQQNTKTTGDEVASLESVKTSQADQQNTKTTGDERASMESSTLSMFDSSTAETTPFEVIQSNTTITKVKHIQNETESTTTTKPSLPTAQTSAIDNTQEKTKNIEVTSTQNGTDFLDDGRGLEDRSNATVTVE